jgi:LSD1 subclass zinc finger protein
MQAGHCERCGGTQTVASFPPVDGVHWVQVRVSVKCLTCARQSPVNRLALDGRFYCYGCSREMLFDGDLWKEKVAPMASGLGDAFWSLVGVFPAWPQTVPSEDYLEENDSEIEDRTGIDDVEILSHVFDKCRKIGRETSGLTMTRESGMVISGGGMKTGAFSLEMSPGHPLCLQCRGPLAIRPGSDGLVATQCGRCGAHDSFRAPQGALEFSLCGVIAHEHVEGREAARVVAQPGSAAIAAACPKCGSSLQLAPGARMVACAFCKTTSVIPDHVAAAGMQEAPRPEPMWLAFRSPSGIRQVLTDAARAPSPRARADSEPDADAIRSEIEGNLAEARKTADQSQRQGVLVGVGIAAVAAAAGGYWFVMKHQAAAPPPSAAVVDAGPSRAAKVKQGPTGPIPIGSCRCSFGDGQSTPMVVLTLDAPTTDGKFPWSLDVERKSGFVSEESTFYFKAAPGALLPPATTAAAPAKMGMACDTGVFALVADKAATGWSSVDGSWKWNATLPSSLTDAADAGAATLADSTYAGGCVPLATKAGAVPLHLASGRRVSLSLKDGKLH